jgi:hypothetical protein
MRKQHLFGGVAVSLLAWSGLLLFAEEPPPPVFENVEVRATCESDPACKGYRYAYAVTNGAGNTICAWRVALALGIEVWEVTDLIAPPDWSGHAWGREYTPNPEDSPLPPSVSWITPDDPDLLPPGATQSPLGYCAPVPPVVREAWVYAWLDPWFQLYEQATGEEYDDPAGLRRRYIRKIPTLAPLGVPPGTFEHWNVLLSDVNKAGALGWIADSGLLSQIQARLSEARQAALSQDLQAVDAKLEAVIALAEGASPAQMRREAKDLIVLNARYLKETLPWPCEPKLVLAPLSATHPVGETATVTATLTNVATGSPIAGNSLTIEVTEGPHAGRKAEGTTDAQGRLALSYAGSLLGTDKISAHTPYGTIAAGSGKGAPGPGAKTRGASATGLRAGTSENCTAWDLASEPVTVTWEGGPDLTVPLFIPPLLLSAPGNTFYVTEGTQNRGTLPSGPSVTRYFLATSKPVDPATALVVGQRSVPALGPGEESEVNLVPFTVPTSLPAGTYYLDACADADDQVVETSEANNCASSSLQLLAGVVPSDRPPDCSQASARPRVLWPPNHKVEAVVLAGVTDPDGDPVTVTVTGITQDEPTDGLGDGDAAPDGFGVGRPSPQVRAERSGLGNGRVYKIAFTASDGKGGSCSGAVTVGVPHDRNGTPVDDGQRYDSTR